MFLGVEQPTIFHGFHGFPLGFESGWQPPFLPTEPEQQQGWLAEGGEDANTLAWWISVIIVWVLLGYCHAICSLLASWNKMKQAALVVSPAVEVDAPSQPGPGLEKRHPLLDLTRSNSRKKKGPPMRQLRFWKPNGTWQREINEHTDAWPSWCRILFGWLDMHLNERAGKEPVPSCTPLICPFICGLYVGYWPLTKWGVATDIGGFVDNPSFARMVRAGSTPLVGAAVTGELPLGLCLMWCERANGPWSTPWILWPRPTGPGSGWWPT